MLRHGADIDEPITKQNYKVDSEAAFFDIALLFIERGKNDKAEIYFKKVPNKYNEWLLGFDDIVFE